MLIEPGECAAPRRRGEVGVEARLEQIGEAARDIRMVHQHLRDVSLAEGQTGLQQIAAIGAQHGHDAPRHTGRERQAVEAVVVHVAGPDGRERALDFTFQRFEFVHRRALDDELEVLNPGAASAGELQPVRPFRDHLQPHVLEHRQQIGNRYGIPDAEDLQEKPVFAARLGPVYVQIQPLRLLVGRLEEGHIQRGGIALKILGVGGGKSLRIGRKQLQRIRFVEARQQRGLE